VDLGLQAEQRTENAERIFSFLASLIVIENQTEPSLQDCEK